MMSNVTAIWTTKTGCNCAKCRTQRSEYHATVSNGNGEQPVIIDAATYDALSAQETAADYREGGYIAFDRPIEWGDVFAEDRVP